MMTMMTMMVSMDIVSNGDDFPVHVPPPGLKMDPVAQALKACIDTEHIRNVTNSKKKILIEVSHSIAELHTYLFPPSPLLPNTVRGNHCSCSKQPLLSYLLIRLLLTYLHPPSHCLPPSMSAQAAMTAAK
jgi:hypothetical protein